VRNVKVHDLGKLSQVARAFRLALIEGVLFGVGANAAEDEDCSPFKTFLISVFCFWRKFAWPLLGKTVEAHFQMAAIQLVDALERRLFSETNLDREVQRFGRLGRIQVVGPY